MRKFFKLFLVGVILCAVCGLAACGESYTQGLEYQYFNMTDSETYEGAYEIKGIGEATDNDLKIPSLYQGCPVTAIQNSVFENNTKITSALIPDTVFMIGIYAFKGCTELKEVKYWRTGLTVFPYKSNDSISLSAFKDCPSLQRVILDVDSIYMQSSVFQNCTKLESIVLPICVYVGVNAFDNCPNLKNVYFKGTFEDWEEMWEEPHYLESPTIDEGNDALKNATICFYSENKPTDTEHKYWHFSGGEVVVW